jgi:hypothetical protein
MTKEFIGYNEALQLKELGFNEPCFGLYHNDKTFYPTQCKSHEQFHGQVCLAPLYQQAFRWFREKYPRIAFIVVPGNMSDGQRDFFITAYIPDESLKIIRIHEEIGPYETYEEAELECIRKLIKIVKEKK